VRPQLGENFGQWKLDRRLVLVAELCEHTGWRGLAEFAEGDLHRTVRQLRENFLERNGYLHAAKRRLAYPGLQRVGQFKQNGFEQEANRVANGWLLQLLRLRLRWSRRGRRNRRSSR